MIQHDCLLSSEYIVFNSLLIKPLKKSDMLKGKIDVNYELLSDDVFFLSEIDEKWRRKY